MNTQINTLLDAVRISGVTTPVTTQPSRTTLARTILAGTITGLFASGDARDATGRPSMAAGAQKGFQAGSNLIANRDSAAQKVSDADSANKQLSFSNNVTAVKNMMASTMANHEALAKTISGNVQYIESSVRPYETSRNPNDPSAIVAENQDLQHTQDMLKGHLGEFQALPTGTVSILNPQTGRSEDHPTYTILRSNVQVPLSEETAKIFALSNPSYQDAFEKTGGHVNVSIAQAVSARHDQQTIHLTQGVLDKLHAEFPGSNQVDLMAMIGQDRNLLRTLDPVRDQMGTGKALYTQLDALRTAPNAIKILDKMGVTQDQVDKYINQHVDERTAQEKLAAAGDDPKKNPADPAQVTSFRTDVKKNFPGLNPGQVDNLAKQLGSHPTQQTFKDVQATAEKYDAANTSRAQKGAEISDKDQQTMWKSGINPTSHERLSLDNAPDEFLVDTTTGLPIPTSMLSTKKPTMQESNRADFAKSAVHSLDKLNELISSNEAKFGPITGPVDKWMAAHGLSDEYQQAALNYLTFAQSAATGAHVGGRFNVPIMDKMGTTVSVNMDKDQLKGATDSINDIMQQYVDQGGRFSVAQYRNLSQPEKNRLQGKTQAPTQQVVPAGAFAHRTNGVIDGYKTADGKEVKF